MKMPDIQVQALSCVRCAKASKTVNPEELYCALRTEVIPKTREACKHVEALPPPPKPAVIPAVEKKPVEAEKYPPMETVYAQIPEGMIGCVHGREGRNSRALCALTDTDMDQSNDGLVVWFTGHPTDAEMAAKLLWFAFKTEMRLYPESIVHTLMEWYKGKSPEDLEFFRNRLRKYNEDEVKMAQQQRSYIQTLKDTHVPNPPPQGS